MCLFQRAVLEGGPAPTGPDLTPLLKECADSLRAHTAAMETAREGRKTARENRETAREDREAGMEDRKANSDDGQMQSTSLQVNRAGAWPHGGGLLPSLCAIRGHIFVVFERDSCLLITYNEIEHGSLIYFIRSTEHANT